ncbi:MAG: 23S rRNA (guanosine(2251)-2'-O)-methyltransferase RlmB [Candidatus Caldatribacteriaceae bacterium]
MTEYLYGRHPVWEALKTRRRAFERLLVGKGAQGELIQKIESLAQSLSIPTERVDRETLESLVGREAVHQGVVLVFREGEKPSWKDLLRRTREKKDALVLFVDRVEDPRNLGAVIRTAAFFGIDGVVVSKARSVPIDAKAVKASCGGLESVPVIQVNNFAGVVKAFREEGFVIVGMEREGKKSLWEIDLGPFPLGIVVGGENEGIRKIVRSLCDYLVRIPGGGTINSLNVSVAAGIALYEMVRRQKGSG